MNNHKLAKKRDKLSYPCEFWTVVRFQDKRGSVENIHMLMGVKKPSVLFCCSHWSPLTVKTILMY